MNTNSLSYNSIVNSEQIEIQPSTWFVRLIKKVTASVKRSEIQISRARYQLKRQRQAQCHQDFVSDLTLAQKHQLGLYHLID